MILQTYIRFARAAPSNLPFQGCRHRRRAIHSAENRYQDHLLHLLSADAARSRSLRRASNLPQLAGDAGSQTGTAPERKRLSSMCRGPHTRVDGVFPFGKSSPACCTSLLVVSRKSGSQLQAIQEKQICVVKHCMSPNTDGGVDGERSREQICFENSPRNMQGWWRTLKGWGRYG